MKNIKVVILGASSTGKTTIGSILRDKYKLPVFECDDETRCLNDGVWPDDERIVDKLFTQVNKKALDMENIVYITSFLDRDEILAFANKGFKFIELHGDFDFLLKRRLKREKISPTLLRRFRKRYESLIKLVDSPELRQYFPLKFEVSQDSNDQIAREIAKYIT